jgi:hypothetical protein
MSAKGSHLLRHVCCKSDAGVGSCTLKLLLKQTADSNYLHGAESFLRSYVLNYLPRNVIAAL